MTNSWSVKVVQRGSETTYRADDLPLRIPSSVKEHVEAHKLGLPLDHRAVMPLLKAERARIGQLSDEGIVLLAAAMHWGARRADVAELYPGPQWLATYSQRLSRLPDSDYGHTFVLRGGRVAVADDQAMAHAALQAMGDLTVGVLTINDSYSHRQNAQRQARAFDRLAKDLKDDFHVSFKNPDGTYAEALDELGNVVATPADAHAWWMVKGIGNDGKAVDPTVALRRLIYGEGRNSSQALVALRLIHDLDLQPSVPGNEFGYDGRLPRGVNRVVVDGLFVESSDHQLTLTAGRPQTKASLKGCGAMLAVDNNAGRTTPTPRYQAASADPGITLPAHTLTPSTVKDSVLSI